MKNGELSGIYYQQVGESLGFLRENEGLYVRYESHCLLTIKSE